MVKNIGQYSKSLSVLLVGVNAWGLMVVKSSSSAVTSGEWMALAGYGLAFLLAFLVPNASKSTPAPAPVADLPHEGTGVPTDTVALLPSIAGGNWSSPVAVESGGVPSRAANP